MQKTQTTVIQHRKRRERMDKIGLAVPRETFAELMIAKERRGMGNVNELIRYYIGKCLIDDAKYFVAIAQVQKTPKKGK